LNNDADDDDDFSILEAIIMFRITSVFDGLLWNECGYINAKGD
jgi:hypothetical protein